MSTHRKVQDQMGRTVEIPAIPQRIVSIVPSQTELLYDLGLSESVAGITKFCIHPRHWFREKTRVGGTKNVNYTTIEHIAPDLIIANKEENTQEQVEYLMQKYPVWVSDIKTLAESLQMISSIGEITNTSEKAQLICKEIGHGFNALPTAFSTKKAAYFIWRDPFISVGGDTFINAMLETAGFTNIFNNQNRYPAIGVQQLTEAAPEFILLSSEPYPFKDKHIKEFQDICPRAKVVLVDGEMFSWYGSRLLHAPAYFRQLQEQLST